MIVLGNSVHGDGYLNEDNIKSWTLKGLKNGINCNFVALLADKVIGFRITYSANQWAEDEWCSPEVWKTPADKCCYFKCNTVDENYRCLGVGKQLLTLSIEAAKQQGATAGVAHLWKQSPNNSAVSYFTKCGGKLIKLHSDKWYEDSKNGYDCVVCKGECHCDAAEMIIYFD